jgi:hypothetical protein
MLYLLLVTGLITGARSQSPPPQPPFFTSGNLVVAVAGCGVYGGTPPNITPSSATSATPPVGGNGSATGTGPNSYGDDQGAPWNLWQYAPNGASSVTFVNSLQLPQNISGANYPVSNDYGSHSDGTIQLSGDGVYMTIMGYGLNAATFNVNYLNYCPGSTEASLPIVSTALTPYVPDNGNPAMAQPVRSSGSAARHVVRHQHHFRMVGGIVMHDDRRPRRMLVYPLCERPYLVGRVLPNFRRRNFARIDVRRILLSAYRIAQSATDVVPSVLLRTAARLT